MAPAWDHDRMNLSDYRARRAALADPAPRPTCSRCWKALPTCYCGALVPFAAPIEFVILQNFREARNAIATARMAHLSLTNSRLVVANEFKEHALVNELISAPGRRNVLLYPGAQSTPLADFLAVADPRPPVFWVLDAKWSQVPKMLRLSPNVRALPMVAFSPERASTFQIRRQPDPACVSTIEAIYLVIDKYLKSRGETGTEHQALLDAFDFLVQQQLGFVDVENDMRHRAAKSRRQARRGAGGRALR